MSELQGAPSGAIWIGCDHGGYELKQHAKAWLGEHNTPFHDVGCHSTDIVRYPYYAAKVAEAILHGEARRGVLICSTGIGMGIIANKYRGIRAALCTSTYLSRMTRAHNDSNVLCLGGKVTGVFEALDILETWLNTPYEGGRHDISLGLIRDAERTLARRDLWNPSDPIKAEEELTAEIKRSPMTSPSRPTCVSSTSTTHSEVI